MRKSSLWLITAALAAGLLGACSGASTPASTPTAAPAATKAATTVVSVVATPSSATELLATKKAPASLATDDPAWKSTSTTAVRTILVSGSKATAGVTVNAQALYNDTDVWFRLEWPDATQSDIATWSWDGTKWNSDPAITDRVGMMWEMTSVADFEAKGCAGLCHRSTTDPIEKWYMIGPKAGDKLDLWQWTAATTGPLAQANDQTLAAVDLPNPAQMSSSFVADQTDTGSGTVTNSAVAPAPAGPLKMQDPSKPATYGAKYLAVKDAIALDMSKIKVGDKIPRTMLAPYAGSRADIDSKGAYASGKWAVVLHRKLDTGHADDVKFTTSQTYTFGLAVWNDLDAFNHTVTEDPFKLRFGAP
jgi:hypothetical protein